MLGEPVKLDALIIEHRIEVIVTIYVKLTRLSDMSLVWQGDGISASSVYKNMDNLLLNLTLPNRLLVLPHCRVGKYEDGFDTYIYPFSEEDLQSQTLGDLRQDRIEELKRAGAEEVDPLVAKLYYLIAVSSS